MFDRRYWLFGGDCYYPSGGLLDLLATHDDYTALEALAQEWKASGKNVGREWWHIFDREEGKVLSGEGRNAFEAVGILSKPSVVALASAPVRICGTCGRTELECRLGVLESVEDPSDCPWCDLSDWFER